MKALPPVFSGTEAQGLVQEGQKVAQFLVGDYRNFVYLILDWSTRQAAWIDSFSDCEAPFQTLAQHGFTVTHILQTHTHWDHVGGIDQIAKRFPDAHLFMHQQDAWRLKNLERIFPSADQIQMIGDGQTLEIGTPGQTEIRLKVHHTPGHSAGGVCFEFRPREPSAGEAAGYLVTGDTVFIQDCGRTDLPTGSNEQLFESLQKLKKLAADTLILPGHHYRPPLAAWLGDEIQTSPPFLTGSAAELAALP